MALVGRLFVIFFTVILASMAAGVVIAFGILGTQWSSVSGDPVERVFFWGGWGGSLAVIDLDARMSVAYVMNRMDADLMGDRRGGMVVLAAYKALGGATA